MLVALFNAVKVESVPLNSTEFCQRPSRDPLSSVGGREPGSGRPRPWSMGRRGESRRPAIESRCSGLLPIDNWEATAENIPVAFRRCCDRDRRKHPFGAETVSRHRPAGVAQCFAAGDTPVRLSSLEVWQWISRCQRQCRGLVRLAHGEAPSRQLKYFT